MAKVQQTELIKSGTLSYTAQTSLEGGFVGGKIKETPACFAAEKQTINGGRIANVFMG